MNLHLLTSLSIGHAKQLACVSHCKIFFFLSLLRINSQVCVSGCGSAMEGWLTERTRTHVRASWNCVGHSVVWSRDCYYSLQPLRVHVYPETTDEPLSHTSLALLAGKILMKACSLWRSFKNSRFLNTGAYIMKHDTTSMWVRVFVYLYIDYYQYLTACEETFYLLGELIRHRSTPPKL